MDQIRQNEHYNNIPSSQTNKSLPPREESEDCEAVSLPYQIYLQSFTETKTQLFRCQDRRKWLTFILQQLSESNLLEKELIEQYLRHQYRRMCTARAVENATRPSTLFGPICIAPPARSERLKELILRHLWNMSRIED